ncbi:hypothetical protein GOODEAATRI_011188 [Goodea atripinnis]|uniref:Uncharacterized protein n=1 Tax=Goodea atripinnis TaxID=208336 RepID=A0ABV0P3A1_9TELE
MTERTGLEKDQADHQASELARWIQQQEDEALYGEGVEILPYPLLLGKMQQSFLYTRLAIAPPRTGPRRYTPSPPSPTASRIPAPVVRCVFPACLFLPGLMDATAAIGITRPK